MAYITWNCLVIEDCAKYKANEIKDMIKAFRKQNPANEGLKKRTEKSFLNEWATHALCYKLGIKRSRSKDADMQFNLEPKYEKLYGFLGPIALFLLKIF